MKRFMMLQLFAEDSNPVENPEDNNPNEETKSKPDSKNKDDKKPEVKYTDEDVDRIISRKFAEWEKKQQNAVDEAKKLAEMNAQQKAEYERDQFKKQLEKYQEKETLAEMEKTARKMLAENNITVSDELLAMLVSTDAEQTKGAVDGFAKAFSDAVETAVKERLRGEPPKKGTGAKAEMTKEQIMSIKDPELRQQKMLENRELFNF